MALESRTYVYSVIIRCLPRPRDFSPRDQALSPVWARPAPKPGPETRGGNAPWRPIREATLSQVRWRRLRRLRRRLLRGCKFYRIFVILPRPWDCSCASLSVQCFPKFSFGVRCAGNESSSLEWRNLGNKNRFALLSQRAS